MSWRCFLIESRAAAIARWGFVPVGAIYPQARLLKDQNAETGPLSGAYLAKHTRVENGARVLVPGGRLPLVVELPTESFLVDGRAYNEQGYHGDGWNPVGEPPDLTLTPSINCVGRYHGYLTAGVITDDCDGRRFPDARGRPE